MTPDSTPEAATDPDAAASLQALLVAIVKVALAPDADPAAGWRTEAIAAQRRWAGQPGGLGHRSFDSVWGTAVTLAERDPAVRRDETVNPTLPTMAPFRLDRLRAEPFDVDGAIQAIRETASFG